LTDLDPQREHKLLFLAGYEYIESTESSKPGTENRVTLGFTPQGRFPGGFLVSDRNRFEFRWVNGVYSNRYWNELAVERATAINHFRLTPYVTAEFFDSRNQVCTACSPRSLNVVGVDLWDFYRNTK
jgi:hypothetical protein